VPYNLVTPWNNETWVDNYFTPYARLAGRPLAGGSPGGSQQFITDIPRCYTLLINGTTVTENRVPSQDDLADADYYYLGGHEYTIGDDVAQILIDAGYSEYLTPVV
jgi:hypothetical protein